MEEIKRSRGVEHRRLISIAGNYNYSLERIRQLKRQRHISESEREILSSYQNYVLSIDKSFSNINGLDEMILKREYFNRQDKKWWVTLFSRATFYRLRLNATKRFLNYVDYA